MTTSMPKEPEPGEKILRMIDNELGDITLQRDAEIYIEALVIEGLERIEADGPHQDRALEAEDNFRLLAARLRQHAIESETTEIDRSDVDLILGWLCPIYPIC